MKKGTNERYREALVAKIKQIDSAGLTINLGKGFTLHHNSREGYITKEGKREAQVYVIFNDTIGQRGSWVEVEFVRGTKGSYSLHPKPSK